MTHELLLNHLVFQALCCHRTRAMKDDHRQLSPQMTTSINGAGQSVPGGERDEVLLLLIRLILVYCAR